MKILTKISDLLITALNDHLLVRRLTLIWACWLITVVTLDLLGKTIKLDAPAATYFVSVVGLLATVLAFYMKREKKP